MRRLAAEAAGLRCGGLLAAADAAARGWLRSALRAGLTDQALGAANFLVSLSLERLEPRLALRYGQAALPHAVGADPPPAEARATLYVQLGKAAWRLGWFCQSAAFLDAAQVLAGQMHGAPRIRGHIALLAALTVAERGAPAEAVRLLRAALALAREAADRPLGLACRHDLGYLARRAGDLAQAEEVLSAAAAETDGAGRGRLRVELAEVALARGEMAQAHARARAALADYRLRPAALDELDLAPLFRLLGRLAAAAGGEGQARTLLGYAAGWYRSRGRLRAAAQAEAEATACRAALGGPGAEDLLGYLGELVNATLAAGVLQARGNRPRSVGLLADRFGAGCGAPPETLGHAALLYPLPARARDFCRLCAQGRAAARLLGEPASAARGLLAAWYRYEADLQRMTWGRACERAAARLAGVAAPGVDRFRDAHARIAGAAM